MCGESIVRHPFYGGAIQRLRFTLRELAQEELQQHGALGICVLDGIEQFTHHNFHSQFLPQLAPEALLESFAGFAFAAGKLPQAAKVRVRVTLGDEQFARAEDQTGADFDDLCSHLNPFRNLNLPAFPQIKNKMKITIKSYRPMLL